MPSITTACATAVALALELSLLTTPALASTQPPPLDVASVDAFMEQRLDAAAIPGAALVIVRGDQVLHVRGYGHDANGQPVTGDTRFRVASLSKSFTALAAMQLVDAGLLDLDDAVASLVPEFRPTDPRGADITVRQLLDQTSGLADRVVGDFSREQPETLTEAAASLNAARLVAEPGTQFNYHNPNYHLAARVVEVVSGEPFASYMQRHVLEPSGMTSSSTVTFGDEPVEGLAEGHVTAYGMVHVAAAPHVFDVGAGDVVSSAVDMGRWLIVHANGGRTGDGTPVVSTAGLEQLHAASAPGGYALGWETSGDPERVQHSGTLLTFSAEMAVLQDSGYAVGLVFNSSSPLLTQEATIRQGVLAIVTGDAPPAAAGPSPVTLDAILALLTLGALTLGTRGAVTASRWATRHRRSPVRATLRLIPTMVTAATAIMFPTLAGNLAGGRDVTWTVAAYSWPALAILMAVALLASLVTLLNRAWHVVRAARPVPPAATQTPDVGRRGRRGTP